MSDACHKTVAVIGAGGHAKVVISTLQDAGYRVAAVFDDNQKMWGTSLLGVRVQGAISELDGGLYPAAVIAIGSNSVRERLSQQIKQVEWISAIHPQAYVHPSVKVGEGTVIFAGAIIQPDTSVGAHVIVNTGATVDHDCLLGDYVHLAPGVHLAGGVQVGLGAFFGIGSVIIPGQRVGSWATIGAGGAVINNIPDGVTAVGIPALPVEKK
jgi:sugar O-acyltransferase (sialic acid O-acetyltransferase NeuD family)